MKNNTIFLIFLLCFNFVLPVFGEDLSFIQTEGLIIEEGNSYKIKGGYHAEVAILSPDTLKLTKYKLVRGEREDLTEITLNVIDIKKKMKLMGNASETIYEAYYFDKRRSIFATVGESFMIEIINPPSRFDVISNLVEYRYYKIRK